MSGAQRLLILAGPSAVGKTTLARYLADWGDAFEYARSATTRAPRSDCFDSEYLYMSEDAFEKCVSDGEMLEFTRYAGSLYGTPRAEIERIFADGRMPLLVLDIAGAENIKKSSGLDTVFVYLYDDIDILEERLYSRYLGDTPSADGLRRFCERKERNFAELSDIERTAEFADLILKNADIEDTARRIAEFCASGIFSDRASAVAEIKKMSERKIRAPY